MRLPCAQLEDFVECFWILSAPASQEPVEPEIVLPDGKTELLVHFGDDILMREMNPQTKKEEFTRQARVLICGQLTKRIYLLPSGKVGVVAVRFKAAGAARFFDLPFDKIVDRVADLSLFDASLATRLAQGVKLSESVDARFKVLNDILLSRLKQESKEDIFVRQACRYIDRSEGEYSTDELVKLIGFSERQLQRKFKQQVGISPKLLSRILRFQKFIEVARTTPSLTLTEASASCGYYDQSHFIRDFTEFSGVSPLTYLSSEHAFSDHFTSPIPSR